VSGVREIDARILVGVAVNSVTSVRRCRIDPSRSSAGKRGRIHSSGFFVFDERHADMQIAIRIAGANLRI